jgi:hypothetical protein
MMLTAYEKQDALLGRGHHVGERGEIDLAGGAAVPDGGDRRGR